MTTIDSTPSEPVYRVGEQVRVTFPEPYQQLVDDLRDVTILSRRRLGDGRWLYEVQNVHGECPVYFEYQLEPLDDD